MTFTDELPLTEPVADALRAMPAKWGVCLLSDEAGRPVQLLIGKDLRGLLRRRLLEREAEAAPTKRADLRALVRLLRWRRVYSDFEADSVYYEAARTFFPKTYRKLITWRPAWFVQVDPAAEHPRWTAFTAGAQRRRSGGAATKILTAALCQGERELSSLPPGESRGEGSVISDFKSRISDPRTLTPILSRGTGRGSLIFGPIEDQTSASRLIELLEDVFDLCRYHHILVQAPHGQACAYKEMGRCPAPCDGSISMEEYRATIARSASALDDPRPEIDEQSRQMQSAAERLAFERAGRIKGRIEQLSHLRKGGLRHLRRLEELAFVSVQPGPREGTAKLFLVTPGRVVEVCGLIGRPDRGELITLLQRLIADPPAESAGPEAAETIALAAHHLFSRKSAGTVAPLSEFGRLPLDLTQRRGDAEGGDPGFEV